MSPPESIAADPIAQRLDRIEARLDRLVRVLDDAMPTVAMASDTLDEWARDQAQRGVDLDARVSHTVELVERLTEPKNAAILQRVVTDLPRLASALQLAATFDDTVGMLFDMFDAQVATLQAQGIDPEQRFGQVAGLLRRITDPEFHHHLERLLDAAPGLMAATQTGELFGRAIDEVRADPSTSQASVGPFGLWRALSDPHVKRAVAFGVAVARKVGERLPSVQALPRHS